MSTMKKKAYFLKDMSEEFRGFAALFQVEPSLDGHKHVIVSATVAIGIFGTGPETYIFGANEKGEVVDWGELEGSFQGGMNIAAALARAGYEIENRVVMDGGGE